MKKVIVLLVVAVVAFMVYKFGPDYWGKGGVAMEVGFGHAAEKKIDMHIVLKDHLMPGDPRVSAGVWNKFVQEHFQLKDTSGSACPVSYAVASDILTLVTGGNDAGFLTATLDSGRVYTLSYCPDPQKQLRYETSITAPAGNMPQKFYMLDAKE